MKTKVIKNPTTPNSNLETLLSNLENMKNNKDWHQSIGVGSASYGEGISDAIEAIKEYDNRIKVSLWDTYKLGLNCEYHYVTSTMTDDEPVLKKVISFDELENYVRQSELNIFYTGPNQYESMSAWDYAIECWDDVKTLYWNNYLHAQLEMEVNNV